MKTELAKLIKEDGQPIRAIHNYLIDVMEDLKGLDIPPSVSKDEIEEDFKNCMICAVGLLTEEETEKTFF